MYGVTQLGLDGPLPRWFPVVGEMVLATNFTPPGHLHGQLGCPHGIAAGIQG